MKALLAAERVHLRHAGAERDAIRDVSMGVRPGEILALVGPNGSGKSTLLAGLARETAAREGRVALDGVDVRRIRRRRFASRVAFLPQEPACPEGLRVEELVRNGRHPHAGMWRRLRRDDHASVHDALLRMDLLDLRQRPLESLSGGERRRAWIAMVLAQQPEVMLLDEPTAALDLRHQWEVLAILKRINQERGMTIVLSLHDLEQAASLAHRIGILFRGRLYDLGAPEACIRDDMLLDVFGVETQLAFEAERLRVSVLGPGDPTRSL